MTTGTDTGVDSEALRTALLLQTWLSPGFPTGAFSYSHGLETAIASGRVVSGDALGRWLDDLLQVGSLHNEAVLFCLAWHAAHDAAHAAQALSEVNALAVALAGCAERHVETTSQADAFVRAMARWPSAALARLAADRHAADRRPNESVAGEGRKLALPVVVGAVAADAGIALPLALGSWLQSFTSNLAWIAVRLVPLGQAEGLSVIASLQDAILEKAGWLATQDPAALDALIGSCSPVADIAAMQHERLGTRICLT